MKSQRQSEKFSKDVEVMTHLSSASRKHFSTGHMYLSDTNLGQEGCEMVDGDATRLRKPGCEGKFVAASVT